MPLLSIGLEPVRSAILKGHAGAGDEIGHRARHEHFAGGGVPADGACALEGAAGDTPLGRQIALAGVKTEMA
jgi:hypothetical protein